MQVARNHDGTLLCGLLHYVGYITKALHEHLPSAARTRCRLSLMPRDWNRRVRRDGTIRTEPVARAPARLARRQADHDGRRGSLLAWERGTVARLMQRPMAHMCAHA